MKQKHDTAVGYFDNGTFFAHKTFCIGGIDITAPAKLEFTKGDKSRHAMRHGEYLYALPAGGVVTESGKII